MRPAAVLALVLAVTASPAPASGQEFAAPTWLGITFETPAARLRDTLGDPVRLTRLPNESTPADVANGPPERKARYVLSFTSPVYLIVSERHGAVVGIEIFSGQPLAGEVTGIVADPSGIALGATEAAVLKAHPDVRRTQGGDGPTLVASLSRRYVAAYSFAGGRVSTIDWFARASTDPPGDGSPLSEPAGDSAATAILVVAKTETEGVRWQQIWAAFHPCSGATRWLKDQVATSRTNGRMYDAVRYSCPATGATRTVYFDITSFYGKL
jgi:hypothetical protein